MFKKILTLIVIACFISMLPLSMVEADIWNPGGSQHPYLTPKWTASVSGGGEAIVTADVLTDSAHPGEEVFHAGGPAQPNPGQGSVTCVSGQTGNEIWRTFIYGVGDTATMQMADVERDGKLEIIVALQAPSGLYILNAEDGSLLWRAPGSYNGNEGYFTVSPYSSTRLGGRIDGSGVTGDTDGDDYPDIFIGVMAYEEQPTTGQIIHYEWDPAQNTIVERGRVQVWHPCAGGLALGDTDNDGIFELYMNERGVFFGDGGWGRGLSSFWANNLTKRWSVYGWGASSNIPMLVDVNKDGIVDVVSTDLGDGIIVLNSTDGRPLRNSAGTLLRSSSLGIIRAHYQSSIYDVDGDDNPELLCADGSQSGSYGTQVFDLWSWKLDADIKAGYSFRGPSIGEVTGDGQMDIIVVTFDYLLHTNTGSVKIYNKNYQLLDEYTGLVHRAIGSVVQDVDRDDDGLNELIVLTQGGKIYCFDTPGYSQEKQGLPRARSEIHFYSESRLGASTYVPFERPWPDITHTNPASNAVNVSTSVGQLTFELNHPLGQTMIYTVTTTPNVGSGSATGVRNGLASVSISHLAASTVYRWRISVTDQSGHTTNKYYWFTTAPTPGNAAPSQSTPRLSSADGGNTHLEDISCSNQTTTDLDDNAVTNIYNWLKGSGSGTSITNLVLPFDSKPDTNAVYSGMAVTRDYSGRNNDGNVFGATWTKGIVGGAFSFDGNDFIRVEEQSNSLDGGGLWSAISIEFWIKATQTGSSERLIWKPDRYYDTMASYQIDFQYRSSPSRLEFTWSVNTTASANKFYTLSYQAAVAVTSWHHVVCTYKSGIGLVIYFDGVKAATNISPALRGNIINTDGSLEIAFNSGGDFVGVLDEVRLYPSAISEPLAHQRYLETKDGSTSVSTMPALDIAVGDVWRCQITPNDGLADGTTRTSNSLTVVHGTNTPPVASNLMITPTSPTSNSTLVATYTYYDAENNLEYGSLIQWYKNGEANATGPFVPIGFMHGGEVWYYTVRPKDGYDSGSIVTSPSVTIINSPPSFSKVLITPNPALQSSTLTANCYGWIDLDGSPEAYTYQWQKLMVGSWKNISGATSQTLEPLNFAKGDYLQIIVTPYDPTSQGKSIIAGTWIVDSDPPTQSNPLLASSSGNDRSDDDLICTPVNTQDPNGDQVTSIFNWIIDGTSLNNLILPFETNSTLTANDYSGYSNNGAITGATWTSEGIIGGCYNFNGNDFITVQDSASLGNDGLWSELTIEYWANPSIDQRGARILNKNGEDAGTSGKYMSGINTAANGPANVIFFGVTIGDIYGENSYEETYGNNNTAIPTGSWSHIVGTYSSSEGLRLYINGTLRSSAEATGNIAASVGEPLIIGYSSPKLYTPNRYFNGKLDEIRIYPTALSPSQVFQNFIDQKDGVSDKVTIVPQETEAGQTWRCQVIPNDGWQDGASRLSNQLTITSANTRPRIDWYSPADSAVTGIEGKSIAFQQVSSDPNNNALSYRWTLDSVLKATTQDWTSPALSLGIHTVRVTVSDGTSSDYQEWILHVQPPTNWPPITSDNYDGLWHNSDFSILLTAIDNENDNVTTYYKINNGPTKTVGTNGQPIITMESANNTLEYWSVDEVANEELPHKILDGIKLDKTTPIGSIIINKGAYTNTINITLALSATDAVSGIAEMRFSNDNSIWSKWETYSTSKSWTLKSGEGLKTVFVQYKDLSGLISSYSSSTTLDTTKPVANAGQNQTVNQGYQVTFNANKSTDNKGLSSYTWNFGDGSQGSGITATHIYTNPGNYTVRLTVQDNAGNSATTTTTVLVKPTVQETRSYTNEIAVAMLATAGALIVFFRRKLSGKP